MRRLRTWLLILAAVPAVVLVLLVAAWAIDTAALTDGAERNIVLAQHAIGGQTRSELSRLVEELAKQYADAPVKIVAGQAVYESTTAKLGVKLDQRATIDAALHVGTDRAIPMRPVAWARSFFGDRRAPLRFDIDQNQLTAELAALQGDKLVPPTEPTLTAGDSGVEVVAGKAGRGIDPAQLAVTMRDVGAAGELPFVLRTRVTKIPPRFTEKQAAELVPKAENLVNQPLTVTVGGSSAEIPPATLRSWLTTAIADTGLALSIDPDAVGTSLRELFPDIGTPAVDASFTVTEGRPVVVPSKDGTGCCEPGATDKILQALTNHAGGVEVGFVAVPADFTTEEANALGIVEEVGNPTAFGPTTEHPAGQPRVSNIHRIADIVRGQVIEPGETFSVNGFVGKRTRAKGFVNAPVIYQGKYEEDIGGGVSQFATTLFNAALYAGLDFGEYQSHSIYISRYPKGHEATISYEHPDLELVNNTPHGVLIWPTYTDSSITVHLYSTKHADVSLGSPTSSAHGKCTKWTTPRTRTFSDGSTDKDSVFAIYRPAEGVNC